VTEVAIGLKRDVVELVDHNPEWEQIARETIGRLWRVFGSVAKDIQHIGSTAIPGIKAKPVIDIAVAVDSFDLIDSLVPIMEKEGFILRHQIRENEWRVFLVYADSVSYTRTHHIHIVKGTDPKWKEWLCFRDYLNAKPHVAKEYEAHKTDLMEKHKSDRTAYTDSKHDFVMRILHDAYVWACLHDIPGYDSFVSIAPLTKGWSSDKKYVIETDDGQRLLLRVADIAEYEKKKTEFEMMKKVAATGIPMQQPVDFGVCDDGKSVYTLLTWVDGEDAQEALPLLPELEQYALGKQAGQILRKMQSLSVSLASSDWLKVYGKKIDRYISNYRSCGLSFESDETVIAYIEQNRHLMDNRPMCFTHDDYHPGNMILSPENELFIIDFQRFRNVEPYHAMSGLVFSAAASPHFATGQIHGYFDGQPPADFWLLFALYLAAIAVNALPWSIPYGQNEIDFANNQIADVLRWFDNMQMVVPTWYLKDYDTVYHYDALIDENNDPVHDPAPLREHMDQWDGVAFIDALQLAPDKTVLEIGVGTGRLAMRVCGGCARFTGIDISPKTSDRARENLLGVGNTEFICGDFLSHIFNARFDIVYSSLTFMHIADKRAAIQKAAALLNPGGRFVLSIAKSQDEVLDFGDRKVKLYPDSPEEIGALLGEAGLEMERLFETELAVVFAAKKENAS